MTVVQPARTILPPLRRATLRGSLSYRTLEGCMEFHKAFPVAIIDEDFDRKTAAGRGMRDLAAAIENEGFRVVSGLSYEDAQRLVHIFNTEACWLVSVDGS